MKIIETSYGDWGIITTSKASKAIEEILPGDVAWIPRIHYTLIERLPRELKILNSYPHALSWCRVGHFVLEIAAEDEEKIFEAFKRAEELARLVKATLPKKAIVEIECWECGRKIHSYEKKLEEEEWAIIAEEEGIEKAKKLLNPNAKVVKIREFCYCGC